MYKLEFEQTEVIATDEDFKELAHIICEMYDVKESFEVLIENVLRERASELRISVGHDVYDTWKLVYSENFEWHRLKRDELLDLNKHYNFLKELYIDKKEIRLIELCIYEDYGLCIIDDGDYTEYLVCANIIKELKEHASRLKNIKNIENETLILLLDSTDKEIAKQELLRRLG